MDENNTREWAVRMKMSKLIGLYLMLWYQPNRAKNTLQETFFVTLTGSNFLL